MPRYRPFAKTHRILDASWTLVGMLALGAVATMLLAATTEKSPTGPSSAAADVLELSSPSGPSLYVLPHTWINQSGTRQTLADLAGRPQVVAMVYTHCGHACPMTLARMMRIQAAFRDLPADRAPGLVLVSIDPERDTPERLADFAESAGLDPERWTLLTGSPDAVLELSVLLDVKYQATEDGSFSHSNVLTVLDDEGRVASRLEGLSSDLQPALDALEALVSRP